MELGERYGNLRAIQSGLKKGDVIAVNGPARVGPGMPIAPNKVNIDTSKATFVLSALDKQLADSRKEL